MKPTKLFFLCVLAVTVYASAQPQSVDAPCATSILIRDSAPPDPNAGSVDQSDWYINVERTIWAGPVPDGGWVSGGMPGAVGGNKTYWVRPQGSQLVITGRRLDGDASPVHAHIPCCYPTGFQIVGLYFPTDGCWEVHAKAGDSELRFVTKVGPPTDDQAQ